MHVYDNRLATYDRWPVKNNNECLEQLALVGFYYTGYKDCLMCCYCKFESYNYIDGTENTLRDHKRYSPNCPFYKNNQNENYVASNFLNPRIIQTLFDSLPAPHSGDYSLMEQRVASFFNFPSILKGLVNDLCVSGFYYTNTGDLVCCYACKVLCRDWKIDANVHNVHMNANKNCQYLKIVNVKMYDKTIGTVPYREPASQPSAPYQYTGYYKLPDCLKCKSRHIDAVALPCYHMCTCQQCALTITQCVACNVFVGGFFRIKLPLDKFNLIENEEVAIGV
ncbi:iap-5 [Adoxophyes orana granulovirus]|uniref:Iap-5 n=1 Tax=Adoxophyes orana granulovirus TaxID=170617 RepID=Q7T9R6_GVAO|nr:iap-5 [Adoxophyes orana granulovirus]AAP85736.1 iap-5 [Adoxophyes orana granulovirus]AJA91739.1 IAP-5 [Adoxophyes orana granulovirus]